MKAMIERLRAAMVDDGWSIEERRVSALRALAEIEAEWDRLFAPVDVEAEVEQIAEGIVQAAESPPVAARTWIRPLVEDRARLGRAAVEWHSAWMWQWHSHERLKREVTGLRVIGADRAQEVTDLRDSLDIERRKLADARAEIARLKSAPGEAWAQRAAGVVLAVPIDDLVRAGLASEDPAVTFEELEADHDLDSLRAAHERARDVILLALRAVDALAPRQSEAPTGDDGAQPFTPERARQVADAVKALREALEDGEFTFSSRIESRLVDVERAIADAGELGKPAGGEVEAERDRLLEAFGRGRVASHEPGLRADAAGWVAVAEASLQARSWGRPAPLTEAEARAALDARERVNNAIAPPTRILCWKDQDPCPYVCDGRASGRCKALPEVGGCPTAPDVMAVATMGASEAPERLCVAVLCTNAEGKVLLVQTRRGRELPGGGVHEDETPLDAAIREAREETGLIVTLDEGAPVTLPATATHCGALLFRGRAEGRPTPGGDAVKAAWCTRANVLGTGVRLSDLASRDVLLAWAREASQEPTPGAGQPITRAEVEALLRSTRPRVSAWVEWEGGGMALYDERGQNLANVTEFSDGWKCWACRPCARPMVGGPVTREEAMAAAVEVLATWCDVSAVRGGAS